MRSYHPAKFVKIWISLLKFKFCWVIRTQPISVLKLFLLYISKLFQKNRTDFNQFLPLCSGRNSLEFGGCLEKAADKIRRSRRPPSVTEELHKCSEEENSRGRGQFRFRPRLFEFNRFQFPPKMMIILKPLQEGP